MIEEISVIILFLLVLFIVKLIQAYLDKFNFEKSIFYK